MEWEEAEVVEVDWAEEGEGLGRREDKPERRPEELRRPETYRQGGYSQARGTVGFYIFYFLNVSSPGC